MAIKITFDQPSTEKSFLTLRPWSRPWVTLLREARFVEETSLSILLTDEQVAEYLQLRGAHTLAHWRTSKKYSLPYIRIGRAIRYRKEDVEAFLLEHRQED